MKTGVEYIREVCKAKKIPVSKLEKDLGYSNGYLNPKKIQKLPYDRAVQISQYLGIDVSAILDTNSVALTARDNRDIAKDLDNIMAKLSSGEDGPAAYNGEELDPEAAELFKEELEIALRRLKLINKEKYTPKKYKK
jgi:transcriptional regulator with XRE-family HTH domain